MGSVMPRNLAGHSMLCPYEKKKTLLVLVGYEQFLGALRGLDHRLDQRNAQSAFFELENSIDRAARWSRHGILQQRGMMARLERDFRRAERRLRGEERRKLAREPAFTPPSARDSRMM